MTRRSRNHYWDPVARAAISPELGEIIWAIVESLKPVEVEIISRRLGLGGTEEEISEIAKNVGIAVDRAKRIENSVMSRLRHPSNSIRLSVFDDGELSQGALDRIRKPLQRGVDAYHHSCAKHGDSKLFFDAKRPIYSKFCPACGCSIISKKRGRPLIYCEPSCKMVAHRLRKNFGPSELTPTQAELAGALYSAGHGINYIVYALGVTQVALSNSLGHEDWEELVRYRPTTALSRDWTIA